MSLGENVGSMRDKLFTFSRFTLCGREWFQLLVARDSTRVELSSRSLDLAFAAFWEAADKRLPSDVVRLSSLPPGPGPLWQVALVQWEVAVLPLVPVVSRDTIECHKYPT